MIETQDIIDNIEIKVCAITDVLGSYIDEVLGHGYLVSAVCIEDQFLSNNITVVKKLSRLVGAISYVVYKTTSLIPVLVPPESAKKSIGISSNSYKHITSGHKRAKAIHKDVREKISQIYGKECEDDEAFGVLMAHYLASSDHRETLEV